VVKNNGANCIIACNGREALALLVHQPIHAVLMDLHMPIMNGFEATAEIRKLSQFASLPIIALTASVSEETRQKCLATGMNDFIDKPLNVIELISKLKYWTSYI
jgi:CheY-like chemotaxis protein